MNPNFFILLCLSLLVSPTTVTATEQTAAQSHHHITQQEQYICPMHSHIVDDEPGQCPICGMALEKRRHEGVSAGAKQVQVSGQIQQAINIQTDDVRRGDLWKYIETKGVVTFDEGDIRHIHPRVVGWIENLHVATNGQPIKKGELLYTLYSPDLVVAQDDYLQIMATGRDKDSTLYQRARRRLTLLGMSDEVIRQLEQRKRSFYQVPFYASRDGIVSNLKVREGMYVTPDESMMTVANLTQLWVIADVFESQFDWVKLGRPAEVHIDTLAVHEQAASIDYIYPELDASTASLKVRLTLANPLQRIKPGMHARVIIYGGPKRDVVHIPVSALISDGVDNRVVVKVADERFAVRQVTTGMRTRDRVEILDGLLVGEQLVVSGQFLIDSEASLQGASQRLQSEHQH